MEGLTLVGLFMEGTTLTCLETYSDTKKRTLALTCDQNQRASKLKFHALCYCSLFASSPRLAFCSNLTDVLASTVL
jgi:hypothetical protein